MTYSTKNRNVYKFFIVEMFNKFKEVKMFKKRGQAAMEFLMTYGWAILAAIIAIGVLVTIFGFGGNLSGSSAAVSAPFVVNAQKAQVSGVSIEIKNGGSESLIVNNVTITNCGTKSSVGTITAGDMAVVDIVCTLTQGDQFRGDISIGYQKAGSGIEQFSTGSINTKVVA